MEIPLEQICRRYQALYVPAVSDVLDGKGLWHQILDPEIAPLIPGSKVAGPAFTMLGVASREQDKTRRLAPKALDALTPGVVAVMTASGDRKTGHWGELMTNAARYRGCSGAVVDGGIRDTEGILAQNFPIFYRFRCPGDALGRFNVVDFQCPITVGDVQIHPGDFVFGDADGVVVVPRELVVEVLLEAEQIVETEKEIRERVRRGESVAKLYLEYEQF